MKASVLSWSNLRPLLRGIGPKAAIAFPALGYLVIFNDQVAKQLDFESITGGSGTLLLTNEVRLQCLYFGFLFLSGAAAWFNLRAPKSVTVAGDKIAFQSYAFANFNVFDYVQTYLSLERKYGYGKFDDTAFSKTELYQFLDLATAGHAESAHTLEDDELWFLIADVSEPEAAIRTWREFLGALLDAKYDYDQFAQRTEAKYISALCLLALVLLAIPSIDVFVSVVADILGILK